jgi:hypothetical protein
LTVAQLISIGLWIFGLVLFLALPRKTPASPTTINA